MAFAVAQYELPVIEPYRLDLTVSVLRRLSTNLVDVLTPDGAYLRVLGDARRPVLVRVSYQQRNAIFVTLEGERRAHERALETVQRMLGVNAIVFQQVSIHAASAILRRYVVTLGSSLELREGPTLHAFPDAEVTLRAKDDVLRAAGLSTNKIAALRRVAETLVSGTLDERMLKERSSVEAAAMLRSIKGIGPWTATVVLLRGLGRLDVFPKNDSGVAGSLAFAGGSLAEIESVLDLLGSQRGMLYYHLLLARLEARGEL